VCQGRAARLARLDGGRPGADQGRGRLATPPRLDRNLAFSQKHRINGTPALFFEDGTRKPGALSADAVDKLLAAQPASRPRPVSRWPRPGTDMRSTALPRR
jgi:protein-disulfide isomerase